MIKVRRIRYATFETPDLEKAVAYYTQVNGLILVARESGRAFLATGIGELVVALEQGQNARCLGLSFEVAASTDFAAVRKELSDAGIQSEERREPVPGVPRLLSFRDPNGTLVELFSEWSYVGDRQQAAGVGPLKLGHVAFYAPDPKSIAAFYERCLGFRVSDWIDDFFVFMRCGPEHHSVNFLRGDAARVHHFAFELKDFAHIQNACDLLARRGIPLVWGPLRFGPGHNVAVFHRNHDDHLVEFYIELDQMKDEALGYFEPRPWHRDKPQRPKVWKGSDSMIWGPPPPPGFM
jgi:catechol 2,3-dioxygenase-like lactoylglutathione lyase family enzyme